MTTITVPIELELTPRSQAVMAALQQALSPQFIAEEPKPVAGIPSIGAQWPGVDGVYAGISRGEDGQPDAHLVLLNGRPADDLAWNEAMKLAEQRTDGARLPTRFESALLYANLRDQFDTSKWHWTGTQSSELTAWSQLFNYGLQLYTVKKFEARVRFVRRFPL